MLNRIFFINHKVVEAGNPCGTGNLRNNRIVISHLGGSYDFSLENGAQDGLIEELISLL